MSAYPKPRFHENSGGHSFELPGPDQITALNQQHLQAIQSLEITEDGKYVKCMSCSCTQPIYYNALHGFSPPGSNNNSAIAFNIRIRNLQTRIQYTKDKYQDRPYLFTEEEKELSDLVAEVQSMELLRKIQLYQFEDKLVYGKCFDESYGLKYRLKI